MHSGDAPEDLFPYVAYYSYNANENGSNGTNSSVNYDESSSSSSEVTTPTTTRPTVNYTMASLKGKAMATSMGFDYVIVFDTTHQDYMKPNHLSLYCSAQAFKIGIPAVDIECGKLGQSDATEYIDRIVLGITRLLSHLNMTTKTNTADSSEEVSASIFATTFIHNRSFIDSSHTGIWYPNKKAGDKINKGELLGLIKDYFGSTQEEIVSDTGGLILYNLGTPPVNIGETLVSIGMLENDDDDAEE